jgi:hypothetical protein
MGTINWGRVLAGGLLAGLVLNVWDFVLNGVILANDWNAAMRSLGKGDVTGSLIVWFVLYDFLFGIFMVWFYAAIRPRYGAGPKTAALAGLTLWLLVGVLHAIGEAPVGLFPMKLYTIPVLAGFIAAPLAALVGARPYKEA